MGRETPPLSARESFSNFPSCLQPQFFVSLAPCLAPRTSSSALLFGVPRGSILDHNYNGKSCATPRNGGRGSTRCIPLRPHCEEILFSILSLLSSQYHHAFIFKREPCLPEFSFSSRISFHSAGQYPCSTQLVPEGEGAAPQLCQLAVT